MSLESTIAKLLAKAEGTTNPHEAEAFMAKAEEMMLKNGIDRAAAEAHLPGHRREEIVTVRWRIKNGHGYALAMEDIAHAMAPNFSIKSFQTVMDDGSRIIWYVGHESDVKQAEELAQSLISQSRTQALHWWKTEGKQECPGYTDNDAYIARRQFISSFGFGAGARLRETRSRVVEESDPGTSLMLVDRKKLVTTWVDENMNVGKARRTNPHSGSDSAARAGRSAGREAVGTKKVTR
jgi:hypothetical protein